MDEETRPENAKVVFPESGSRIDAAARAIGELRGRVTWANRWPLAETALNAADEAEASIAEKLAAALRFFVEDLELGERTTLSGCYVIDADAFDWMRENARVALAEFEKLRASAPVENPK